MKLNKLLIWISVFMILSSFAYALNNSNIVLYSPMNESSGSVLDQFGSNDMSASGSFTYGITGALNDAINFTTTNTFVRKTSPTGLPSGADDLAISFWFKGDTTSGSNWFTLGTSASNQEFTFRVAGGTVVIGGNGAANDWDTGFSVANLSGDVWSNAILTVEDDITFMYINGVYRAFFDHTRNIGTGVLLFNRHVADLDNFGLIIAYDELMIWNRTLTNGSCTANTTCGGEIAEVYNNGSVFDPFPVVSPPTNSSFNVTSDNIAENGNRTAWNGGDVVNVTSNSLPFTFTSDVRSNWTCSKTEGNYSQQLAANANNKIATTNATSHSGTLFDNLTEGDQCVYCSGITIDGEVETATGVSSSGCLNVTGVSTVTVTLSTIEGLNSSSDAVSGFTSLNLQAIETMRVNFTINSTFSNISDWSFNFTANGTSACSLGNQQDSTCFNFSNSAPNKWIEFINGTNTTTFDATDSGMAQGDAITPTIIQDDSENWKVSLLIDEHYNPNIAKHYPLNFSDLKFQNGTNQRITTNNIILINFSEHHDIPLDADQYKLDFRINCSASQPNQPLDAFVCNADYFGLGISPHDANSSTCAIVAQKSCSELQDDGTKFRGIFTDELVDEIGSIDYVVLDTFEPNVNRYFFIKTYKDPLNDTHWLFSTDEGGSFSSVGDGYESEVNLNWFYNTNQTEIIINVFANNTQSEVTTLQFNNSWDINLTEKFVPIVSILDPEVNDTIILPSIIRFSAVDPNDDNLNITFTLSNSTSSFTLITDLNQSNTSFIFDNGTIDGLFNLTMLAVKIVNSSFNDTDVHEFNIIRSVILNAPLNATIESTNNTIVFNCTGNSNVTLVNMSLYVTNESNENFVINGTNNITGTTNTTTFNRLLQNGNYTWNCEVCFNDSQCFFGDSNFTLTIPEINFTNQTNGNVSYGVNWSIANITNTSVGDWFDHGNFTINTTESDIEISPAVSWLFNFTNNDNITISVSIQQNQTKPWYSWFCNSTNITTALNNFISIDPGNSSLINCTLDLINAKQTYLNHNLTADNGSFDFTHIISAVR